mmetsp:Transcript_79145/g.154774  ORF Transcript_79145/g.154774 Transcript_79145/m.154774 type:complete len:279 (-) Transcript_79145:149-985(-)
MLVSEIGGISSSGGADWNTRLWLKAPAASVLVSALFFVVGLAHLHFPHLGVPAVVLSSGEQFSVGALLEHAARLHHHDLVCVSHGGQAVRDQDGGAAPGSVEQVFHHMRLGGSVERGRGFVAKQDGGVFQQRSGNAHALLLSPRQLQTSFPHRSLQALAPRLQNRVQPHRFQHLQHFLVRSASARAAVAHVVAQRVVEQHNVLRHHRHVCPHFRQVQARNVHAVHQHPPAPAAHTAACVASFGVVEAEQEAQKRALAAPAAAHHGHARSRGHVERDAV